MFFDGSNDIHYVLARVFQRFLDDQRRCLAESFDVVSFVNQLNPIQFRLVS